MLSKIFSIFLFCGSILAPVFLFPADTVENLEATLEQAGVSEKAVILSRLTELYGRTNPQKAVDTANEALLILENHPDKKVEVEVLNYLSLAYRNKADYASSLETAKRGEVIARETGNKQGLATALNLMGITYNYLGDYIRSLESFSTTLMIFKEAGSKKDVGNALNNMGIVYEMMGSYEKALEYYLDALKIKEELGDKHWIASTLNNIGVLYNLLEHHRKALEYLQRALTLNREIDKRTGIAITLTNIGNVYLDTKEFDPALTYYREALTIDNQLGNKRGISSTLNNIGLVYSRSKDHKKAMNYYRRALEIREKSADKRSIAKTLLNMAEVNQKTGFHEKAVKEIKRALALAASIDAGAVKAEAYEALYKAYEKMKNPAAALTYLKKFNQLKAEILDREKRDKILEMETGYRLKKKEDEIKLLKRDKLIKDMTIKKKELVERVFILGVVLLVGVIGLLYHMYRLKTRVNNQLNAAYKEVEASSRTDYLTGIANRRHILETVNYEKNRFTRIQKPFVLVIGDIDDFKHFNDTCGHDCGDFVLIKVAELLGASLRKQDSVGRWGGEEFILLLPETTLQGGRELAEKIRRRIAETTFVFEGKTLSITMTFGLAAYDREMPVYACLKKADEALYKGKDKGKNCVA